MNNMHYFLRVLPFLGFFTAVVLAWYFYVKARNKERMALIERGDDLSKIYTHDGEMKRFPWLKVGILITGIALGFVLVAVLVLLFPENNTLRVGAGPLMIIVGSMFGGISMIVGHYIDKSRKAKKNG